jgi:hypothetical protein
MALFHAYIGVDYSGAGEPGERQPGLQVYRSTAAAGSVGRVTPPGAKVTASWSRRELAAWLGEEIRGAAGFLGRYLEPPLTEAERELARLEGWILGVA